MHVGQQEKPEKKKTRLTSNLYYIGSTKTNALKIRDTYPRDSNGGRVEPTFLHYVTFIEKNNQVKETLPVQTPDTWHRILDLVKGTES